jgi:hypothetical protein
MRAASVKGSQPLHGDRLKKVDLKGFMSWAGGKMCLLVCRRLRSAVVQRFSLGFCRTPHLHTTSNENDIT